MYLDYLAHRLLLLLVHSVLAFSKSLGGELINQCAHNKQADIGDWKCTASHFWFIYNISQR